MGVSQSRAGQMDLHMALNYSRGDDKRYKNVQVARIGRPGRVVESAGPKQVNLGRNTVQDGVSLWIVSVPVPSANQIPLCSAWIIHQSFTQRYTIKF
jgi:hypothetical protein